VVASGNDFVGLSRSAQVIRMRTIAARVIEQYDVDVTRMRLLEHGFNTTFRLDTSDGSKLALRINVNSRRSPENVAAETAWIAALAHDTELVVAAPIANRSGAYVTTVAADEVGQDLHAVVFSWLDGRDVGHAPTVAKARAMGRAMAVLHQHAAGWRLPRGSSLPTLSGLYWNMDDHLVAERLDVDRAGLAVLRRAVEVVESVVARIDGGRSRQPIHADVHPWNVKWSRGRLSVFDFDDSGLGFPVQDLAVSTFYLRPQDDLVDALREGYASVAELPLVSADDFEALVAQRSLLLLNDLVVTTNAEHRQMIPGYTRNTILKVGGWLDTGIFRHDVDGLVPLA
jgi:Ser/Thr protein kinase RdoA (MazF antagonist)